MGRQPLTTSTRHFVPGFYQSSRWDNERRTTATGMTPYLIVDPIRPLEQIQHAMRLIALLTIMFLRAVHGAEPAPKLELFVGQTWEAAKEVIAQAKLIESPYPHAAFVFDDNKSHSYNVDDELIVTLFVSPSSESIVSMRADFIRENRNSRADYVQKSVDRVSLDSSELYTIQFKRDLRTPEEKEKDLLEVIRILKEQDEKSFLKQQQEKASKEKTVPK